MSSWWLILWELYKPINSTNLIAQSLTVELQGQSSAYSCIRSSQIPSPYQRSNPCLSPPSSGWFLLTTPCSAWLTVQLLFPSSGCSSINSSYITCTTGSSLLSRNIYLMSSLCSAIIAWILAWTSVIVIDSSTEIAPSACSTAWGWGCWLPFPNPFRVLTFLFYTPKQAFSVPRWELKIGKV